MKNLESKPIFRSKNGLFWAALAFLSFSIQACNPTNKPSFNEDAQKKVAAEATTFLQDYYAAICEDGLSREFEFLDSSADFHWKPLGSERILTYDTVAAMVRRNISSIDTTCATWTELKVTAKASDTAHYEGKLHSWTVTVDGDTISEDFEEMGNLIKRQGRWWLLNGETRAKF